MQKLAFPAKYLRKRWTDLDQIFRVGQWRKPGPQFGGGTKNFFAVPQIKKFGGTARNSLFLGMKQLSIE